MNVLLFALPRYLLVALLCGAAYVIGNAILRRLEFACLPERLAICTAFGLGVLSHLVLLVGVVGWLTPTGVIGGIIALGTVVTLVLRKPARAVEIQRPFPHFSRLTWSLLALSLVTTVALLWPLFLLPLYPPTDFDETMVHLAVPKMWLAVRAVIVNPFLRNQILPHLAQTLFAVLMLAKDDIAPKILSLVATGLIAIGLYGWGKRVYGVNAGILAATFWMGSPIVLTLAPIASYHALAALFAF